MAAGFSATVDENNLEAFETSNSNFLSWKTGEFDFDQTAIGTVIRDLNTYYTTEIVLDKPETADCALTAHFNQTALEEVLEIITLTCDKKIKTIDNQTILY